MLRDLGRALRAERLKLRRGLTQWAIVGGALFVPLIMLAVRYRQRALTETMLRSGTYWRQHWLQSWESISVLTLPLLIVLVATYVIQLETRHNTWKQLHATPLALPVIYVAKLVVLLALLLEMYAVTSAGLFLAGWLPSRSMAASNPFPWAEVLLWNGRFFVDALPILGFQYALALLFRTVLAPLAIGVGAWIAGLVVINTPYVAGVPYGYLGVDYLVVAGHRTAASLVASVPLLSLGAFAASVVAGLAIHALARDRGAAT